MASGQLVFFAQIVSRLLGWLYFLAWSASFYPQPIYNWQRRSTLGLAIDFPTCNVLGFVAYTLSTGLFLYSPTIRSQYAYRHPAAPEPTVRFNDFLFALHGAILCVIVYTQFWPRIWGFKVGARQRASRPIMGIMWGSILGILATVVIVQAQSPDGGYDPSNWAWIEVVYALSYVKLIVTVVKYIPQAWYNYQRKSTEGWSIYPMLLDFSGGIMSLAQLLIDSSLQADWSGVTGNPAKLLLSNVTLFFDIIFLLQHYVFYRNTSFDANREEDSYRERQALLASTA